MDSLPRRDSPPAVVMVVFLVASLLRDAHTSVVRALRPGHTTPVDKLHIKGDLVNLTFGHPHSSQHNNLGYLIKVTDPP